MMFKQSNLLPVADLAGCGVVLWTILQTRKHLGQGSEADGKGKKVILFVAIVDFIFDLVLSV